MGCIISDVVKRSEVVKVKRSEVVKVENNPINDIQKNECPECPVCYIIIDEIDAPNLIFFNCSHILCNDCYKQLIKYKCPLCRAFPKK